jgi:hypothetical protein
MASETDGIATGAQAKLRLGRYEEIDIARIGEFPELASCLAAWTAGRAGASGLPAAIDISTLAPSVLPYTMLIDRLPGKDDVRVRMAGNYVGERARFGGAERGLRGFFDETDAKIVFDSFEKIAASRLPSLARRDYVSVEGRKYRYVRLILPVSADGETVTGFFKTIEPGSLQIEDFASAAAT